MRKISEKKGAINLSIGTLVIIVLAMSMLILGIILIRSIFTGATDIADMTNDQLKDKISTMFGEDKKLVVYPDSRHIEIEQEEVGGFGIGIKNLLQGTSEISRFSYEVIVSDPDIRSKCGISEREAENYITTGRAEDNLEIPPGGLASTKVLLNIPVGSPLCTIRYRVNVRVNNQVYATEFMDVTFKAA